MIKVDETDPVGDIDVKFPYRKVTIKRGEDAKQYYELNEEIGRGKFGTVYKCKEKSTGTCLAAKFIAVPNRQERKNVEREIEMMNNLQHPKIIQLYDAYEYNKMVCVVLELIDGGELFDRVLDDKFILTEKACAIFMRQICDAMDFIHANRIIHLDLKPENVLCLTEGGNRIKIIDFGLAREYDPFTKLQVLFGTPEFVAPEVVNFEAITFATDMWSVGVIAYVLVSGLSPFAGECDVETMGNVTVGKYDFNDEAFDNVSPECIDFITKCLMKAHGERLTAKEALKHKWIKRKPQYYPSNQKTSHPLGFKAVYLDKDNTLTTKDNLRNCVDRWNESTPYVFDKDSNSISPVHSTISSSIGFSPSPTGSFNSSSECLTKIDDNYPNSISTSDDDINNNNNNINTISCPSPTPPPLLKPLALNQSEQIELAQLSLKDYLQTFERRNSDSSLIILNQNHLSSLSSSLPLAMDNNVDNKINLFDEIKKLTDHLFKLTSQDQQLQQQQHEIDHNANTQNLATEHILMNENINVTDVIDIDDTLKEQSLEPNDTKVLVEHEKSNNITVVDDEEKIEQLTVDENNNININDDNTDDKEIIVEVQKSGVRGLLKKFMILADSPQHLSPPINESLNAPWPVSTKRTKFRINQMSSRDVPIYPTGKLSKLNKPNSFETTASSEKHVTTTTTTTFRKSLDNNNIEASTKMTKSIVENNSSPTSPQFTMRSFFQSRATTGTSVKQIQAQMEAKNK
ncbi:unnamed protein product [Diamesa tonsa]